MISDIQIPEPIIFNPLKHHFGYIKEFINTRIEENFDIGELIRELKHLGSSVMDVYSGSLSVDDICKEVIVSLQINKITERELFALWAGKDKNSFRIIPLSDDSKWTLKYHRKIFRYVHLFPERSAFRVKANTMKSALLYTIIIGKNFVTTKDINEVRRLLDLSPIKDSVHMEAITEMIELLRD